MPTSQFLPNWTKKFLAVLACLILIPTGLLADPISVHSFRRGFVHLPNGQSVYAEIEPGRGPTIFLLNGLTYNVREWDLFVSEMRKQGRRIVRYDMRGQGRTLESEGPPSTMIQVEDQVEDLQLLREILGDQGPSVFLGLSYGGGIAVAYGAKHGQKGDQFLLMSPFTRPIPNQDAQIRYWMSLIRMNPFHPWNVFSDADLYDLILAWIVTTSYPLAEPIILGHPYRIAATVQLARGIRRFLAEDVVGRLPPQSLHMIVGERDQYLPTEYFTGFWDKVPDHIQASFLTIEGARHKIPEQEGEPSFAASWINLIIGEQVRELEYGLSWRGNPVSHIAISRQTKLLVPMASHPGACEENLFRKTG